MRKISRTSSYASLIMYKVFAPFNEEQIANINNWQQSTEIPTLPYTCLHHSSEPMIASKHGLDCPIEGCGYHQNWVHPVMAEAVGFESIKVEWENFLRKLRENVPEHEHLDPGELETYCLAPEILPEDAQIKIKAHVDVCPKCRSEVDEMDRNREYYRGLKAKGNSD